MRGPCVASAIERQPGSEVANALKARGIPTARGGKREPTQIADILKRAK
jgi:hypothetical protein